jgi:hypothetical protein
MPTQPDTTVERTARKSPAGRFWVIAALLLTAGVSLSLMFLPLVSTTSSTVSTTSSTEGTEQTGRQSLIEDEGWGIAAILAVPVLISAVPLLVPARHRLWATIASAALLTAGALVAAASVGLFYLPSAGLLFVAVVVAAVRSGTSGRR